MHIKKINLLPMFLFVDSMEQNKDAVKKFYFIRLLYSVMLNDIDNYAHRLVNVGERYYQYDANGNVTVEQDGKLDEEAPVTYHRINKEAENVFSTDYDWGLFREKSASRRNLSSAKYRRTYTWDERNQLINSVDANYSVSYVYGQDGQRSNKYTASSETLYFNKMWTLHTDSGNSVRGGQCAKNIYLGETRIVTKLHGANENTPHEERYKQYFYHSDHLGSASLITDYKGDEYQRIEYTPYGETWVERTQNTGLEYLPYKFTGKEMDEETGLYYYGARYLDPKYSRWISVDPALGEYVPQAPINDDAKKHNQNLPGMGGVFNSVNLSLFHYAGNNPVRYMDPDGREDISSISMKFKKSTQSLTVKINIVKPEVLTEKQNFFMHYYKVSGNAKITFTIKLTNNVRTPEQRGNIPVKFRNYYYFPENFPNGTWNVTDCGFNENLDIGWYIRTDAGQMVDTYQKNDEGEWVKTGNQVYDTGYLLHGSDGDGNRTGDNNEDYSTWGCGRGDNFDLLKVIFYIKYVNAFEGKKTLQVED